MIDFAGEFSAAREPLRWMHEYDVALKDILTRPGSSALALLTGSASLEWQNVEVPRVTNRRIDLLGKRPDGDLVHIELQSRNEGEFAMRMAVYLFEIGLRYGRLAQQVALYVGEEPMRMSDRIEARDASVRFHLVDIRDLDGEELLCSANLGDNVLAVLTRWGERPRAVRAVLERIATGEPRDRDRALTELLILARLRRLSGEVIEETTKMPILEDIMDHDVIGPLLRKGRAEGLAEGQMKIVLRLIEKRFGPVSQGLRTRIEALDATQLENVGLKILDARSVEELFDPSVR